MSFQTSKFGSMVKKTTSSIKDFIHFLREKKILKGLRVTYKSIWNLFLIFAVLCLMFTFFAFGAGAGYFASLVRNEKPLSYKTLNQDLSNYSQTSNIYFAHNVLLGKMHTDLIRYPVKLDHISKNVKQALIATEDQYFYQHHGVVPKSVMRALVQEMTNAPIITGGSTLTQQLVKNQILTPQVSFKRKAKEMLYAMRVERFFSKSQILQDYLNVVPFGRNASGQNIAGIQAAAQGVFGVSADKLNLPQAAFLAGMPQNPFTYTPFKNEGGVKSDISAGIDRMHTVLKRMLDAHFINKKQYDQAMKYDIKKHLAKPHASTYGNYPAITSEIQTRAEKIIAIQIADKQGYNGKQLAEDDLSYNKYLYEQNHPGISTANPNWAKNVDKLKKDSKLYKNFLKIASQKLSLGGYQIHTTIDKKIYDKMQKAAANFKDYEHWVYYKNPTTGKYIMDPVTGKKRKFYQQVAAVLIKNDTGAVISFVGGRNYQHLQYNMATQALRSNGSSMKPILVYAPAMQMGLVNPGSVVADLPFHYPNKNIPLRNYALNYHGLETVRKALYRSHNIPAVKTFMRERQHGQPIKYLKKMGVTTLVGHQSDPVAIGSLNRGISVLENTNAYDTFGNGGNFVKDYMISKISDTKGNVIYQHHVKPVHVFSPQTSYLMTDMMRDVLGPRGTAGALPHYLNFKADWAGKTGTSQNFQDEWFEGTNPNVSLGTWIGYQPHVNLRRHSGNNGHYYSYPAYSSINLKLWAAFANAAYKVDPKLMAPKKHFQMPTGIVKRTICLVSGELPSSACKRAGLTITDLFEQKSAPSKVANVISSGGYVIVNGKKYIAHSSTPREFVHHGLLLDSNYMKKHFIQFNMKDLLHYHTYYFTQVAANWTSKVIPANELKSNGKTPSPVSGVSVSGGYLHWNRLPENDIVGYRVYIAPKGSKSFTRMGSVVAGHSLSYPVRSGAHSYYVTAVDIDGHESSHSAIVNAGTSPKPKPQPKQPKKTSPKQPKKTSPKQPKKTSPKQPKKTSPKQPKKPKQGSGSGGGSKSTNSNNNKTSGTTNKTSGTTNKSSGTTNKSSGTTNKSSGTTNKSSGTTNKSSTTTKTGSTNTSSGSN